MYKVYTEYTIICKYLKKNCFHYCNVQDHILLVINKVSVVNTNVTNII